MLVLVLCYFQYIPCKKLSSRYNSIHVHVIFLLPLYAHGGHRHHEYLFQICCMLTKDDKILCLLQRWVLSDQLSNAHTSAAIIFVRPPGKLQIFLPATLSRVLGCRTALEGLGETVCRKYCLCGRYHVRPALLSGKWLR